MGDLFLMMFLMIYVAMYVCVSCSGKLIMLRNAVGFLPAY